MSVGIWQLLLILAVVLVIFGPGKLPNAIKDIGKGIKSLKDELQSDSAKEKKDGEITDVTPKSDKKE